MAASQPQPAAEPEDVQMGNIDSAPPGIKVQQVPSGDMLSGAAGVETDGASYHRLCTDMKRILEDGLRRLEAAQMGRGQSLLDRPSSREPSPPPSAKAALRGQYHVNGLGRGHKDRQVEKSTGSALAAGANLGGLSASLPGMDGDLKGLGSKVMGSLPSEDDTAGPEPLHTSSVKSVPVEMGVRPSFRQTLQDLTLKDIENIRDSVVSVDSSNPPDLDKALDLTNSRTSQVKPRPSWTNYLTPYELQKRHRPSRRGSEAEAEKETEKTDTGEKESFHKSATGYVKSSMQHIEAKLKIGNLHKLPMRDAPSVVIRDLVDTMDNGIVKRSAHVVSDVLEWWYSLKEPPRSGWCYSLINSKPFESFIVFCIICNGIFTGVTTNMDIQTLRVSPPQHIQVIEILFLVIYIIELTLKLIVHGLYFFCNADMRWNIIDFFLVIFGAVDAAAIMFLQSMMQANADGNGMDFIFLRSLRLFKVVRIVRMLRALRFFEDLRLMMDCVVGTLFALFWCLIMIAFVQYVFGLFIVQSIATFLVEQKNAGIEPDPIMVTNVMDLFGSIQKSVLVLLQSVTAGRDWNEVYEVIQETGDVVCVAFLCYILFFVVAAWNIITSTFVEKALKIAAPDFDKILVDKHNKDIQDAKDLMGLFRKMDTDHSDMLSFNEFMTMIETTEVTGFLEARGIDIKDAKTFFHMLSSINDSSEVDICTFVNACLRMKGLATSVDLHTIGFQVRLMQLKQVRLLKINELYLRELLNRMPPKHADQVTGALSNGHDAAKRLDEITEMAEHEAHVYSTSDNIHETSRPSQRMAAGQQLGTRMGL